MTDPTGGLPEWLWGVASLIGAAGAGFAIKMGWKDGEKAKATSETVGAMMAVQPSMDRMTTDTLVQTLATLTGAVNDLIELLERQEREKEEDERAELRELRRTLKDLRAKE